MIKLTESPSIAGVHLITAGIRTVEPRTIRQFAENEIVPATGNYKDEPFRCSRQPFTGLLFDEIDRDYWQTIVISGPSQSSKTLSGLVIPTLWQTCELNETTVLGIPEADMADNKWQNDFVKIMENSPRLRGYLPRRGSGSKGGKIKDSVELSNGVPIKIMTRGGADTAKAGYTTRFVNITEAAGFSYASDASEESDTLRQLKARMRSYDVDQRRMIIEGTLTIESELPWRLKGDNEDKPLSTMSRLLSPCPHCEVWISPGRNDFHGWQEARSDQEAADNASFYCPACGEELTEDDRKESNGDLKLVHLGQSIDSKGEIVGDLIKTSTLWFHWSQWHNLLIKSASSAVEEWTAAQLDEETTDHQNAERELCQFIWSNCYEPPEIDEIKLKKEDVIGRAHEFPRSQLPQGTKCLGLGVDIRTVEIHYCVIAFVGDGSGVAIDFDIVPPHIELGVERGIEAGLIDLRDKILSKGYGGKVPKYGFIDARWKPTMVRKFVLESRRLGFRHWYPSFGFGQSTSAIRGGYNEPTRLSASVTFIGDQYYMRSAPRHRVQGANVNADEWKGRLHDALAISRDRPGSLQLYEPTTAAEVKEVNRAGIHITNEKMTRKVVPDRGVVRVFVNHGARVNHYLDAFYNAMAAGHFAGNRIAATTGDKVLKPKKPKPTLNRIANRFRRDQPHMSFQRRD